jgi:hypothetical protein
MTPIKSINKPDVGVGQVRRPSRKAALYIKQNSMILEIGTDNILD